MPDVSVSWKAGLLSGQDAVFKAWTVAGKYAQRLTPIATAIRFCAVHDDNVLTVSGDKKRQRSDVSEVRFAYGECSHVEIIACR